MSDVNDFLNHFNNLFDPNVGFWSVGKMTYKAKQDNNLRYIPPNKMKQTFRNDPTYQRHTYRYKKSGSKIHVHTIGSFQIDFADFTNFNDTHNYLLVIIDTYSRYLIAYPCKTKSSEEYIPHLTKFIQRFNEGHYFYTEANKPNPHQEEEKSDEAVQTGKNEIDDSDIEDNNSNENNSNENNSNAQWDGRVWAISSDNEFAINEQYQALMAKNNIQTYHTMPNEKSGLVAIAERCIKTLRGLLGRYFSRTGNTRWVQAIQQFVNNYNSTKHRTIGVPPKWALVTQDKSEKPDPKQYNRKNRYSINIGDWVRIPQQRDIFHKKTNLPYWSKRVYIVSRKVGNRFVVSFRNDEVTRGANREKTFPTKDLLKIYDRNNIPPEDKPIEEQGNNDNNNRNNDPNDFSDPHYIQQRQSAMLKKTQRVRKQLDNRPDDVSFLLDNPKKRTRKKTQHYSDSVERAREQK